MGRESMAYYAAIDASPETVNICIVEGGGCVLLERKVGAEPEHRRDRGV
jgi:hypothetical protein